MPRWGLRVAVERNCRIPFDFAQGRLHIFGVGDIEIFNIRCSDTHSLLFVSGHDY